MGLIPDFNSMISSAMSLFRRIPTTTQLLLRRQSLPHCSAIDRLIICSLAVYTAAISVHVLHENYRGWKNRNNGDKHQSVASPKHQSVARDSLQAFQNLDAEFAEQLQFNEALIASLHIVSNVNEASSSVQASEILCDICLENKEKRQMYNNNTCSHSFCYECTTKHVLVKISERATEIRCPGINCNATLDAEICRMLIPAKTLVLWDEYICKAMYNESQKLYCPYRDCSALFVNDIGVIINKTTCPRCKRSICASCGVPWHTEFTCSEFKKLNAKSRGKEDAMVLELAKKKNWQKCPKCNIIVEKTEGCLHMTCICKYHFCYRCGAKWSINHCCRSR